MQRLPRATNDVSAGGCAWELLDVAIPLNWYIRRRLRVHRRGLSVPQFRALVLVANQPTVCLSAVSDHLEVSLPNASRIVSGLVVKRLLARTGCVDDRRQMSLEITARGRDVLDSAWAAVQNQMASELSPTTTEQRRRMIESMTILKSIFGSLSLPRAGGEPLPISVGRSRRPAAVI